MSGTSLKTGETNDLNILRTLTLYSNQVISSVKACTDSTYKLVGISLFVASLTDLNNEKQLNVFGDLTATKYTC